MARAPALLAALSDELEMHAAALDYHARGWVTLPLKERSKAPSPLPLAPCLNVGIVTGAASSLVVFDADAPPRAPLAAPPGMAVRWLLEHGGRTLMSDTGGGGLHALYRLAPEALISSRTALLTFSDGSQLDLRAEGGYIVAPPSTHPNGRRYAWREGTAHLAPALPSPALVKLLQRVGPPTPFSRFSDRHITFTRAALHARLEKPLSAEKRAEAEQHLENLEREAARRASMMARKHVTHDERREDGD